MGSAEAVATGVCFQCGGSVRAAQSSCHYCGMPVLPELVGAASTQTPSTQNGPTQILPTENLPTENLPTQNLPAGAAAPTVPLPQHALTLGTAAPQRRIGRKPVLIGVAALVTLVLVVTVIPLVSRLFADTPESTVEDYFDALGDGDAVGALKLVSNSSKIDTSRYPLLTDAGLADRDARPREVKVGDATEASGRYGEGARTVDVAYRAGDTTVDQEILVVKGEDGDGYQLRGSFVELDLNNTRGREVTVNGVALSAETRDEVVAFPGMFKAEAAATALLAGASVTAPPVGTGLRYEVDLDFGPPQLASGAQERIEESVKSTIDQCAASTEESPDGCPFSTYIFGGEATVRWSVTTYPEISVDTSSIGWGGDGDEVSISDDGSGSVHWTATYSDFFGGQRTESGDETIRINGTVQASGSDLEIDLN